MKVYYPEDLFNILKQKHLLLDTNVLIDSFNFDRPVDYTIFFNDLKENDTTLTTIEAVVSEFLKGSKKESVYERKQKHINDIMDVMLPSHPDDNENIKTLIKLAEADGGGIDITDYYLGTNLLKYTKNLFLMTRNVRDFPQHIFSLKSTVSFSSSKTIFTYGIYTYIPKQTKTVGKEVPF